ncbi:hypothetical protein ACFSQ3_10165 [Sphingobacterium corticis]|uniref:Uncharacterized protein n=1 Tax=Sphingobacterium corticis TaxID=1812823 RepID=A0ABW5NMW1_9SPHI
MQSFSRFFFLLFCAISILSCWNACQTKKKTDEQSIPNELDFDPAYSLFVSKNSVNHFLFVDSTWNKVAAIPPPNASFNREFIIHKKHYYEVNADNDYFIKYRIGKSKLEAVDSIKLVNDNIEQFHWKNGSDTLLLCNVKHGYREICHFYEIDTKNFKLIREAIVPIPSAVREFNILSIGLMRYQADKIWLAYTYSKMIRGTDYTTIDTMFYATLDYQNLKNLGTETDGRSTYPGGINTIQTYSGTAENGDFYFTSSPGIAAGNAIELPSSIFRKKQNETTVDSSYMINISEQIKNHAYGFWYLGKDKAIVRSEQSDKFTDFANHHAVYQFDYFLTDLTSGKMERLDLPLDKGTRKENVIQVNQDLYIAIDDDEDRHTVWKYNLPTKSVSKHLTPKFPIDYILRLDRLK